MKVKMKFDAASIKKLGLEHGEKLAFGLMALVFLGFVYFAIRREVLPDANRPENLQSLAGDVRNRVSSSKWDAKAVGVELIDFGKRAKRDTVDMGAFAMAVPFNGPISDPKIKREDPALFNVEELQVSAGYGPFALKGEAGGGKAAGDARPGGGGAQRGRDAGRGAFGFKPPADAKLVGQAWVVITGVVPYEKQQQEYARVFERALGENHERDTPHYAMPLVERAEVNDADPKKLDWQELKNVAAFEDAWVGGMADVVAAEYLDPSLTAPLGPLVDSAWDKSVAHPKIPLVAAQTSPSTAAAVAPPPPAAANAPTNGGRHRSRVAAAPPPPPTETAPKSPAADAAPHPHPYKLLRVFDYSVQPHKRYRYRVKLGLDNPNFGVKVQYLRSPEAPRPQVRDVAEWTAPTDVVSVPDGNGVLAGGLKPQKTADPAKAKLMLTSIDKDSGVEASIEQEFERGAVANLMGKKVKTRDPRTEKVSESSEIDFKTNSVVLDIYGGRALSKKKDSQLASPVEVLLLDASGHLTVHSELDDLQMYEHRKPPEESESRSSDKSNTVPGNDPVKPKKPPRAK